MFMPLQPGGSDVYVGGDFTSIGGLNANRIAKWDGHSWSTLGSGIGNGIVYAIAVDGSVIYVGGTFTTAGGVNVSRIAKWDGRTWSVLAGGISECNNPYCSPAVYAIEIHGSNIFVDGEFGRADKVSASGIAMWNGSNWFGLGGGIHSGTRDGIVMTLAVSGSDIYMGGKFSEAGGISARNIAKWSGNSWSGLGNGIRGDMERVRAIGISGSEVYVGGGFNTAGEVAAHNVAKWNGRDWTALTIEAGGEVWAITVSGREIYLGSSSFKIPGGKMARGIVKWNNGSWSALGEGMALPLISAIRASGCGIYVGGG